MRAPRSSRTFVAVLMVAALSGCAAPPAETTPGPSASPDESLVVNPGESWIVYQYGTPCGLTPTDPSTICLVKPDGTGRHALPMESTGEALHPDWSPDGLQLTYVLGGSVWASAVDGSDAREIASCTGDDCLSLDYPAWSPDGSSIAFTRYGGPPLGGGPPSTSSIIVADLETGDFTTVTETEPMTLVDQARWSPDGTTFVVQIEQFTQAGSETGAAIGTVPSGGGTATPITDFALYATYPDWNPVSNTIVFVTHDVDPAGGPVGLFTVNADGTALAPLAYDGSGTQRSTQPSWTPDGAQVIFVQWDDRATTLVSPDGSGLTVLSSFRASHPRLRPLG